MKTLGKGKWLWLLGLLVVGAAAAQEPAQAQKDAGVIETSAKKPVIEPPAIAENEVNPQAGAKPLVEGGAKPEEAHAKKLPPEEALPFAKLLKDFKSPAFWFTLLVALICGGLGGVVYELLTLQGNVEKPHPANDDEASAPLPYALSRNLVDFGVWARVIIGGLAAVAAIWLLSPKTGLGLVAGAIIAGSAGTSVFRSLQDRLLATLAQKDAAEVRATADLQIEKVTQALANVKAARAAGVPGAGATVQPASAAPVLGTSELKDAERFLTEAQAIGETLQRKRPVK